MIKLLTMFSILFPKIFSNYKELDQLDYFISFACLFHKYGYVCVCVCVCL